jgi:hypothetical protein
VREAIRKIRKMTAPKLKRASASRVKFSAMMSAGVFLAACRASVNMTES